jgi:Transglycosylase SLT domain
MRSPKTASLLLATIVGILLTPAFAAPAPKSSALYERMTPAQQASFITEQARSIARRMSGVDYEFTPAFEAKIQRAVGSYMKRIGNNGGDGPGKGDARYIFERGQNVAPTLIKTFKARNVSPLIGLYIPAVESEYVNINTPNSVGAVGMFQFIPSTGERYGLNTSDLLDVEKSADAAARYIAVCLKRFDGDKMKEALALLAYNRGENNVARDLAALVNEQNSACSICALTAQSDRLDATFQNENIYYVPRFFAAAIIGENPQAFGLATQPLSSLAGK